MNQHTNATVGEFAGAVSRLGRLVDATKRINEELAELPEDMEQGENPAIRMAALQADLMIGRRNALVLKRCWLEALLEA